MLALSLLAALLASGPALSQEADVGTQGSPAPAPDPAAERPAPDIDLHVRLRADSVRVSADPDIRVQATGTREGLVTESSLPDPIQAGRTYRNVRIDTRLRAWLEGEGVVVESEATLRPDADGRWPVAEPDAEPEDPDVPDRGPAPAARPNADGAESGPDPTP